MHDRQGTQNGIHKNAVDFQENKGDENTWRMLVVQRALFSGITTPGDDPSIRDNETPALELGILELKSMYGLSQTEYLPSVSTLIIFLHGQSQSIDPRVLPALPNLAKPLPKKADFALAFNKAHPEVNGFYCSLSFGGRHLQLSQMANTYTRRCAMFPGLEIKASDGSEDEKLN